MYTKQITVNKLIEAFPFQSTSAQSFYCPPSLVIQNKGIAQLSSKLPIWCAMCWDCGGRGLDAGKWAKMPLPDGENIIEYENTRICVDPAKHPLEKCKVSLFKGFFGRTNEKRLENFHHKWNNIKFNIEILKVSKEFLMFLWIGTSEGMEWNGMERNGMD